MQAAGRAVTLLEASRAFSSAAAALAAGPTVTLSWGVGQQVSEVPSPIADASQVAGFTAAAAAAAAAACLPNEHTRPLAGRAWHSVHPRPA